MFNRFFSAGRRFHSPSLTLVYATADTFHVSAVAPKKHFRHAVDRNKFRRRIYEIMRVHGKTVPMLGAYIFIAKKHEDNFDEIRREVLGLVSQSKKVG